MFIHALKILIANQKISHNNNIINKNISLRNHISTKKWPLQSLIV